jgi:hypothetical protein
MPWQNTWMSTSNSQGEPITEAGLASLKTELGELETVGRREIAARILTARGHGDLKENAEYHAAKEDQAHLETKISRLRSRLGTRSPLAAQRTYATRTPAKCTHGASLVSPRPTAPPANCPPSHL